MNSKYIHGILFVFLVALTANMVHVISIHDNDVVCEICLHIQSNHDFDAVADSDTFIEPLPTAQHAQTWHSVFISRSVAQHAAIRAPPILS